MVFRISPRHVMRNGEQGHQSQHGNDGDILEQKHRKAGLPRFRLHQPLFVEGLEHDGRRRQGEDHAQGQRHVPGDREQKQDSRDEQHGAQHLQAPFPENGTAQLPEERRLQFQSDDEEHHYHAEFGEVHHIAFPVAREAQGERTDDHSGDQIAENRAQPQTLGDGHRKHGGGQIDERLKEKTLMVHGCLRFPIFLR